MDEKLQRAIAIVLSDELEPDRVNELVDSGLADHQAAFDLYGIPDDAVEEVVSLIQDAQSRNHSRGWATTCDKYAPMQDVQPRCTFDENGRPVVE